MKWVFRVLYSPMKTFEEIARKPTIKGPILILLIMLPIAIGAQYLSGTKFFFEYPKPENDLWTEHPTNSTQLLWSSNGNITFENYETIMGNDTVSATLSNSSSIWLRLTDIGSVNCSEGEYSRLSLRTKWANGENAMPINATLQLFSLNDEDKWFELYISDLIANTDDIWANVSVNLATDDWTAENVPNWENITGIGLVVSWADMSTLTLKIDDLFFGRFEAVTSGDITLQSIYWVMRSVTDFLIKWLILSAIVFLALKSISKWSGFWKNLMSTLGYVYSVTLIYQGALALAFLVLPPIFIPYNVTYEEYVAIYQNNWGLPISILSLLYYAWTTILCTIALKKMQELSWNKAFLAGFGAVIMSIIFSSILLTAFF